MIVVVVEAIVSNQLRHIDTSEASLLHEDYKDLEDNEVKSHLLWMDSF